MFGWLFGSKKIDDDEIQDRDALEVSVDKSLIHLKRGLVSSLASELERGQTIESLADQCDMSKESFEYYISVPREMNVETLVKVMIVLGWTVC